MIFIDTTTGQNISWGEIKRRAYPAVLSRTPSVESLASLGVEKIVTTAAPAHMTWQVPVETSPQDTDSDGVREQMWTLASRSYDDVKVERKREIDRLRDQGIFAGVVNWTRPSDSVVIPVDMRGPQDRANIQDLRSAAIVMHSSGITNPVLQFRAADNVVYDLSPLDVLQMSQAMLQRGQAWYAAAWAHKDAIAALTTAQEVADYEITFGWPEG